MLILSRKQYLKKYFEKNNLEDNICFIISNFGYFNNEIRVQYLEYFDKYTWKNRKRAWRIFIIDRASCHINKKFMKVCYSKNILLFQLPPHIAHLF